MKKYLGLDPKLVFFTIFSSSLVLLEIAYNDSLQRCLSASSGIIYEKKFLGPKPGQTGQNQVQNYVFCIFSSLVNWFAFKLHRMIAWNNV